MRPIILSWGLVAVAACGKVSANVDGGAIDAVPGPDADPHGTVTVTVLNTDQSGTPVQGVPVVFFDPDGTMVGKTASDAQGKASATVLPGANVSVVWPKSATQYQTATIYAIKPGDNLVVGFRNPDPTDVATFRITYDQYSGATSYQIFGPCGLADASNILHFQAACKTDPFDVYIVAFNSSNQPIAWNSKNGVALSAGNANLPASGWNFVGQFTSSYTNVPTMVTAINVQHVSGFPGGYSVGNNGTPANNMLSLAVNAPTAGTNAWVRSSFTGANTSQQIVSQRIAGAATTAGMDVTATLLPWLSNQKFDPATQQFTVTADSTGTYDTYLADVTYSRGTGSTATSFEWIVLGPTIGTLTLPTLPADVGGVNPLPTDTFNGVVALAIDDDGTGWDSVRDHIFDEFRSALQGTSKSQQLRITTAGF
jgi:hypothetical protein